MPRLGALLMVLAAVACSDGAAESPTSPTTTTTSTASEPTVSETFEDEVPVGASGFYSFSVSSFGTVNVTLEAVTGAFVPPTVMMGLGVGTPSGTDCVTTNTVNTAAGAGPHLTTTYEPGVYCARIWDIGNLYAPARFRIVIAHP